MPSYLQSAASAIVPVINNAGGTGTFPVSDLQRVTRFLILGAEGGTYYQSQQTLSLENAEAAARMLADGKGLELVALTKTVSVEGRAAKQGPTLFVLALCSRLGDVETRRGAYAQLAAICRTPTMLFQFIGFVEAIGDGTGWGRLQRRAIGAWYNGRTAKSLAVAVTKYQQREGWSHRDICRLAHVKPAGAGAAAVLRYAVKGWDAAGLAGLAGDDAAAIAVVEFLAAVEEAKAADEPRLVELIKAHRLAREHVPSAHLNSVPVWEALLAAPMPMTAMIRNLAKMTAVGLLKPLSPAVAAVVARLGDAEALNAARVHPFSVLLARKQYEQGHGDKGSLSWVPDQQIVAALDSAFYAAFGGVVPTGKRFVLALDVSGSMTWGGVNGAKCIDPRTAAAAMSMLAMRTEPTCHTLAFTGELVPLAIHKGMDLGSVCRAMDGLPFGSTDCAQPMLYAAEHGIEADVFVVYTDCETWAGSVSPAEALRQYRVKSGIPARLIVVAMTSNGFTLADPEDAGMLDVVGFDAGAPEVMRQFALGQI